MKWEVMSIGSYDNSVWVVGLWFVFLIVMYYIVNFVFLVVLVLRKGICFIEVSKILKWYLFLLE